LVPAVNSIILKKSLKQLNLENRVFDLEQLKKAIEAPEAVEEI